MSRLIKIGVNFIVIDMQSQDKNVLLLYDLAFYSNNNGFNDTLQPLITSYIKLDYSFTVFTETSQHYIFSTFPLFCN